MDLECCLTLVQTEGICEFESLLPSHRWDVTDATQRDLDRIEELSHVNHEAQV